MALTAPGYISTKDIRRCYFYLNYFLTKGIQVSVFASNDPSELCKMLNESLYNQQIVQREPFVEEMELYCSEQLIPTPHFNWVKNNDRACYWLWIVVRTATYRELNGANNFSRLYEQLGINEAPSNTNERYDCIVRFFDYWVSDPKSKISYMEGKKSQWSQIFNTQRPFAWLTVDDEQCHWVWSRLIKERIPLWFINTTDIEELYRAIFAVFDAWMASNDSKELFLIKTNRAWSQKKYRDNLEGKKPLNTYLNEETKHKLDILSVKNRIKIHEMLEDIIIDAYDRDKSIN
jgi:hypothetical protein